MTLVCTAPIDQQRFSPPFPYSVLVCRVAYPVTYTLHIHTKHACKVVKREFVIAHLYVWAYVHVRASLC